MKENLPKLQLLGAMGKLKTQTVAIHSYLDPVLAIILSALILNQDMGPWQIAGTVLVLGRKHPLGGAFIM